VEAAQADVDLSQAVLLQSQHQKEVGTGTGIDVTRSNVQLADDQQRLLVAKNNQVKAHLQLLRAMNMRLDTQVELTDKLEYKPVDTLSVQDAIAQALATRPDLKAQLKHEDSVRLNASAVKYERLPSITAQFDYGTIGPPETNILPTHDYYGTIHFPIFDGGRRDARRAEAFSLARQEGVKTADLRDQIELDVRTALDSLKSADEQVKVASDGLRLAENELAQARRRYDAGVAASLEVSDASDRLQRARSNHTSAVYNHNLARIDLGEALGKTMSMID
jgi:outer membrane protein TolC